MAEECAECGSTFGSAADLLEHAKVCRGSAATTRESEGEPRPTAMLVCVLCGARFRGPEELAEHNRKPHGGPTERRPVPSGMNRRVSA
jgi:hypothetical protein